MTAKERVLRVISRLTTSPAVRGTIWMPPPGNVTAAEELAVVASELGATDDEIQQG